MAKAPAFQFYVGDYIQDTRVLSLSARGAWQDLLCFMWRSPERGKLSYSIEGYSRLFGASIEETKRVINELINNNICDSVTECNGNVTLINRRMVRDEKTRNQTRKRVERFRNADDKRPCNDNVTPPSSFSSSSSTSKKNKNIPLSSFEIFYESYPVKKAKRDAIKAWKKINPGNGTVDLIINAIKKQKTYHETMEQKNEFVPEWPYPATWLNGKRWEDEVPETIETGAPYFPPIDEDHIWDEEIEKRKKEGKL